MTKYQFLKKLPQIWVFTKKLYLKKVWQEVFYLFIYFFHFCQMWAIQARSQGVQGCDAPPLNLAKGPLLGTKWGFCRRVRGWGSKSQFFGSNRSTFFGGGVPYLPRFNPGFGPGAIKWVLMITVSHWFIWIFHYCIPFPKKEY